MMYGQYSSPETYKPLLTDPVWERAFTWIHEHAESLPDGEHEIDGRRLYANVQTLQTLPVSEAAFEVHKEYLDIHYCISGGEAIGYAPVEQAQTKTQLDREKDYQLFYPTDHYSSCLMHTGSFAIFFPGELHMPKLQNGIDSTIKKVVIKIHKSMLIV